MQRFQFGIHIRPLPSARAAGAFLLTAVMALASACDAKPEAAAKPAAAHGGDHAAGHGADHAGKSGKQAKVAAKAVSGEFELACGCTLEGVGHCSEHAKVDGQFVPLSFPAEMKMGHMPFCGKQGLKAKIEGQIVEGSLKAAKFAYVDQKQPGEAAAKK